MKYAGFWVRVVASVIDAFCLLPIFGLMYLFALFQSAGSLIGEDDAVFFATFNMLSIIVSVVTPWLYEAILYSSPWQATFGKKALGLRVVGSTGERITFGRATARYFSKILSSLVLLAGYIMVAFHEKKRGLHDVIAGTFVLQGDFEKGAVTQVSASSSRVEPSAPSKNMETQTPQLEEKTWVLAGFDENGHVVRLSITEAMLHGSRAGIIIGRDASVADLVIDDSSISRQHIQVSLGFSGLLVVDLGSTNGSSINAKHVRDKPVELSVGDQLIVGSVELSVGKY